MNLTDLNLDIKVQRFLEEKDEDTVRSILNILIGSLLEDRIIVLNVGESKDDWVRKEEISNPSEEESLAYSRIAENLSLAILNMSGNTGVVASREVAVTIDEEKNDKQSEGSVYFDIEEDFDFDDEDEDGGDWEEDIDLASVIEINKRITG